MKPRWELYLSFFFCSFFSAQSSLVSIALVYSKNTHNFFSLSKARPSGLQAMKVSFVEVDAVGYVEFFDIFSKFGSVLSRSWWENLM